MTYVQKIAGLCCMTALFAGCATTLPVQEVRQVSAAYDAAAAAASPLLDELAIAERRLTIRGMPDTVERETEGDITVFLSFDPRTAASFASIGEPVATSQQRRGLKVVGAYVDVLEVLAEGRNIAEAKARIQTLAANVAGLAALATGGTALAAAPVISALGPVLDAAARAENAEELRRLVLDGEPFVDKLIATLIESSGPIYKALIDEPRSVAMRMSSQNAAARRGELLKIAACQVAVANYVVLLEQLRVSMAALASVVRSPSRVSLASLSASTNELLLQAESVRRAYAILRHPAASGTVLGVVQ